jgi:hypothetical protein
MWGSQKSDDPARPRSQLANLGPILAAVLLALTFLTFPDAPPDNDVDSSLGGVLNYARQHDLQFGTDLAFTSGPLGYLMFLYFPPGVAGLRMAADMVLCVMVAMGVCLIAWRLRPWWKWLLLLLFLWIAPNLPTRADFLIYVGLCCWDSFRCWRGFLRRCLANGPRRDGGRWAWG